MEIEEIKRYMRELKKKKDHSSERDWKAQQGR